MPINPSDNEQEYFKKQEIERLRAARKKAAAETAAQERGKLKELHWMRCPKCGMELDEIDFRGVLVDACLTCGGMFFDKGEIDKLKEEKQLGTFGRMLAGLIGGD